MREGPDIKVNTSSFAEFGKFCTKVTGGVACFLGFAHLCIMHIKYATFDPSSLLEAALLVSRYAHRGIKVVHNSWFVHLPRTSVTIS
jgi:hypothetical protein